MRWVLPIGTIPDWKWGVLERRGFQAYAVTAGKFTVTFKGQSVVGTYVFEAIDARRGGARRKQACSNG